MSTTSETASLPALSSDPQREERYPNAVYQRLEWQLSCIRKRVMDLAGKIASGRQPEEDAYMVNFDDQTQATRRCLDDQETLLRVVGLTPPEKADTPKVVSTPERREDYPLHVFRLLYGQLLAMRAPVMALAAEKAQKRQPIGPYEVSVQDQDEALREKLADVEELCKFLGVHVD